MDTIPSGVTSDQVMNISVLEGDIDVEEIEDDTEEDGARGNYSNRYRTRRPQDYNLDPDTFYLFGPPLASGTVRPLEHPVPYIGIKWTTERLLPMS